MTGPWTHAPRFPLGLAYAGSCLADPANVFRPPEKQQEELCNCGYARGVCDRFPAEAPADAIRFSMSQDRKLIYILERNHAPVEHGIIDFSGAQLNPILERQAQMFLEFYQSGSASLYGFR